MANMKQYLISFVANIQGDRIVAEKLRSIEMAQKGIGNSAKRATVHSGAFIKALRRVAIVVPVWFAFRQAMMAVLTTARFLVTTFIALDDQLARIKTVVSANSKSINEDMINIRATILGMAKETRVPITQLAEAFYFLRTSNLDTREAMSAFIPTIRSMVATGISAKEIARAVAGAYNTMGDSIGKNLTIAEKFTKIADTLNFTYATQDVQMNELVAGYEKLAPFASGLSDSFEDLVTMIGFLNTKMLRGGRTGRLLARGMIQIIKNADKLSDIFGITFDPKAPLSFLDLLRKMRNTLGESGKLTVEQQSALQQIFATRGRTPIQLLLQDMDGLEEALKNASDNMEGFTKRLAEIKMDTIVGQLERAKNLLFITGESFITGATGGKDFAESLKIMNDNFQEVAFTAGVFGTTLRVLSRNYGVWVNQLKGRDPLPELSAKLEILTQRYNMLSSVFNKFVAEGEEAGKTMEEIKDSFQFRGLTKEMTEVAQEVLAITQEMDKTDFLTLDDELSKVGARLQNVFTQQSEVLKDNKELQDATLRIIESEKEKSDQLLRTMQKLGFAESQIAQVRLDRLIDLKGESQLAEDMLEITKARNKLTNALLSERRTATQQLIKQELDLMKIRGASESQILQAQQAIENAILGRGNELTQLDRMLSIEKAITEEEFKRKNLSNESVKIWKIAQKQGADIATNISKVVRGQLDLGDLSSKETRILEKQFRTRFEQLQAEKFFFEGAGREIPIPERPERPARRRATRRIRERVRRFETAQERGLQKIDKPVIDFRPTIPVEVKQQIEIQLDPTTLAKSTAEQVKSLLDKAWERKFKKSVEKILEGWTPGSST